MTAPKLPDNAKHIAVLKGLERWTDATERAALTAAIAALDRAAPKLPELPKPSGSLNWTPTAENAHYLKGYEDARAAVEASQPKAESVEGGEWRERYHDRCRVISDWHQRAVALGYDGVNELLALALPCIVNNAGDERPDKDNPND